MRFLALDEVNSLIHHWECVRTDEEGLRQARPGRFQGDPSRLLRARALLDALSKEREKLTGPATRKRVCCAMGCTRVVRQQHLMCSTHWQLVPDETKARIDAARPGPGIRRQVPEYAGAVRDAIAAVASVQVEERVKEGLELR